MKKLILMLTLAGLSTASVSVVRAQPFAIAGDFNGWNNTYALAGGPDVYTNVMTGGTPGNFEGFKIIAVPGSWTTTYPGNNCMVQYDATGQNTVYFYPGNFSDGWTPSQNRVGYVDPGNMAFEITGDFTTPAWGTDPNAQMGTNSSGLYTNTYIIATPGTYGFKIRTPNTWSGANIGSDFGGTGNGYVSTAFANQKVTFTLDLVNGRWQTSALLPPPVTNTVVFAVDMSAQIALGLFTPGNSVYVAGAFNSWPNPSTGTGLVLVNDPPYQGGSNTNIYYGTNIFVGTPGTQVTQYKFNNNSPTAPNTGWETSNNRGVTLLQANGTILLPVVKFSDVSVSDYSAADVTVKFTVNMTNATSYWDGHVFDPNNDQVYINGNFLAGGWAAWNPISLTAMQNDPVGSQIYTYTTIIPAGSPIKIDYKFSMGYSACTNWDDEAAAYNDHFRYIRLTGTGGYTNALDKFGNQYSEPSFGQLSSAQGGAGMVSVSWLGRPGVQLQVCTNLTGGSWLSLAETDGTNWNSGYSSTNGFVSQTNWPAAGNQQFFRLSQSW
jgi:hypothetical protein